ncbi:hypothetical protein FRC01_008658, partial [Tulasnella sp. 417]
AAVNTASGLLSMIPEVGPSLAKGCAIITFGLSFPDAPPKPDDVTRLENDLIHYWDQKEIKGANDLVKTFVPLLDRYTCGGLFTSTDIDLSNFMKEASERLREHCSENSPASFIAAINTLQNTSPWDNQNVLPSIVSLINFQCTCMAYKAILSANLSNAYRNSGSIPKGRILRAKFFTDLTGMSAWLLAKTIELEGWIKQKKEERRNMLDKQVTFKRDLQSFPCPSYHWWFEDHFSQRQFQAFSDDLFAIEEREETTAYVEVMRQYYANQLEVYMDRQFSVVEDALKEWKRLSEYLNKYCNEHKGRIDEPVDGALILRQMLGIPIKP